MTPSGIVLDRKESTWNGLLTEKRILFLTQLLPACSSHGGLRNNFGLRKAGVQIGKSEKLRAHPQTRDFGGPGFPAPRRIVLEALYHLGDLTWDLGASNGCLTLNKSFCLSELQYPH